MKKQTIMLNLLCILLTSVPLSGASCSSTSSGAPSSALSKATVTILQDRKLKASSRQALRDGQHGTSLAQPKTNRFASNQRSMPLRNTFEAALNTPFQLLLKELLWKIPKPKSSRNQSSPPKNNPHSQECPTIQEKRKNQQLDAKSQAATRNVQSKRHEKIITAIQSFNSSYLENLATLLKERRFKLSQECQKRCTENSKLLLDKKCNDLAQLLDNFSHDETKCELILNSELKQPLIQCLLSSIKQPQQPPARTHHIAERTTSLSGSNTTTSNCNSAALVTSVPFSGASCSSASSSASSSTSSTILMQDTASKLAQEHTKQATDFLSRLCYSSSMEETRRIRQILAPCFKRASEDIGKQLTELAKQLETEKDPKKLTAAMTDKRSVLEIHYYKRFSRSALKILNQCTNIIEFYENEARKNLERHALTIYQSQATDATGLPPYLLKEINAAVSRIGSTLTGAQINGVDDKKLSAEYTELLDRERESMPLAINFMLDKRKTRIATAKLKKAMLGLVAKHEQAAKQQASQASSSVSSSAPASAANLPQQQVSPAAAHRIAQVVWTNRSNWQRAGIAATVLATGYRLYTWFRK